MIEHLKMQTKDMANENFEKLAALFPNCVTESVDKDGNPVRAIDKDLLAQEINGVVVEGQKERYQFNWPGKRDAIRTANAPTTMTLRPSKEESVDFDNTQNLYIEGDNLEVLKLLQNNYLGKVKMIYIDPPYNTGNDFVYNDNFKQDSETFLETSGMFDEDGNMTLQNFEKNSESNGQFHTDWLNMIYPRLKVARNLLSDDGVIFISIDDNEQENLKKVCDEIFGRQNFVTNFVWQKKTGAADARGIATITEYILCYVKDAASISSTFLMNDEAFDENRYRFTDDYIKERGPFYYDTLDRGSIQYSDGLNYGIEAPDGTIVFPNDRLEFINDGWTWKWSKAKVSWGLKNGFIELVKNPKKKTGWSVKYKIYLKVNNEGNPISKSVPFKNLVVDVLNADAANDIKNLFSEKCFDYPKPTKLISKLLRMVNFKENDIVLDFFSGSATTAHSVMLNNEPCQKKFILVQLPEFFDQKSVAYKSGYKTICDVGKERIRRAGMKIKDEAGLTAQNLDIGFRVLKLAESNMNDVYYKPADIDQGFLDKLESNIKKDRSPMDLLFQVMLECDLPLSSKIEERQINDKQVFFVNGKELVACFDEKIDEATITEIAKQKPYYFIMRDSSLATDNVADNFEQLFNAYSKDTIRKVL